MNRVTVAVMVTFVALLLVSGLVAYLLRDQPNAVTPTSSPGAVAAPAGSETQARNQVPLLGQLFGPDASGLSPSTFASWEATSARIALRFSLAAFLASLLAFRPRRGARNPYVAQTQILMAVVAGAMMMVVGDSAARAFGIFAAASLVRFRTNIRDPKETTVLLICLGVGLACGVGRLDMALILTIFVLLSLWILEYFESQQVFRAMEVSIATRNLEQTHQVLKTIFEKHGCGFELRHFEREVAEGDNGKIVYELNLGLAESTDQLTEEILASDVQNIAVLEWEQKKTSTYIYN